MDTKNISLRNFSNIVKPLINKPSFSIGLICFIIQILPMYSQIHKEYRLEIKQRILPCHNLTCNNIFIIQRNKLIILSQVLRNDTMEKYEKIYSRKIDEKDLNEVQTLSMMLKYLENEYIKASLDGIRWEIKLMSGETSKRIIIENYYDIPEIHDVFNFINTLIPKDIPNIYYKE